MMAVIESGFGSSNGLDELRPGAGGLADDIEFLVAPVGGHLASAGAWVVLRAYGLEEGFQRGHAEGKTKSAVAVVRVEPIDAGTKQQAGRGSNRFMAGAEIWK